MRIILINKNNFLNWGNKTMMKFKLSKLLLIALMFNLSVSANIFAQEDSSDPEEIIVRGKVLYSDQVTALKTPIHGLCAGVSNLVRIENVFSLMCTQDL